MLSMDAYGTGLGEWSYGNPGQRAAGGKPWEALGWKPGEWAYGKTGQGAAGGTPQPSTPFQPAQPEARPSGGQSAVPAYQTGPDGGRWHSRAQPVSPPAQGTPYGADVKPFGMTDVNQTGWTNQPPPVQGTPYGADVKPFGMTDVNQTGWTNQPPPVRGTPYAADVNQTNEPTRSARPVRAGARPADGKPKTASAIAGPAWTGTQITNQSPSFTPGGGPGNYAYSQADQRPEPFTQSMSFMGMGGDPQDVFNRRAAFVQSINGSRANQAQQRGTGTYKAPARDFSEMWGQAGDMVKNGWQNPLQGLFGS